MAKVEIWTDGSCNNHTHNSGGYGIVMVFDGNVGDFIPGLAVANSSVRQFCGGSYMNTTSARMEILAIVKALEKCTLGDEIIVYSDNQYAVYTLAKGWLFKWKMENFRAKKNTDLWKLFLVQYERLKGNVKLEWVRGHAGNKYNELADQLAAMGSQRKAKIKDTRYN
jgi:ribonuclease HI